MSILAQCSERLKLEGIIVLDAHRNPWDILLTALFVRHTLNPEIILMPIAGYVFFVPMLKQIVELVAWKYSIRFVPVYRRDEYKPVNILMRLLCSFYPKDITREQRERANVDYVALTVEHSYRKGSVIIVAPYGSPIFFGGKIKYGVRKLLETKNMRIVTQTLWSWRGIKFKTWLGIHQGDLNSEYMNLTQTGQ